MRFNPPFRTSPFTIGFLLLLATIGAPSAHAAKFANQFLEFELPAKWQCNLEGAEWVCQSTDQNRKRDAIVILAAKLKGDADSLDQYLAYLKQPKEYTSVYGKAVKSDMKYAKTVDINTHTWVDALHLESEMPGYYTRYLATIKTDIGILVTYSINKDKYQEFLDEFNNMVQTLKVFRKAGGLNAKPQNANLFQNTSIPTQLSQGTVFPVDMTGAGAGSAGDTGEGQPAKKKDDMLFVYLIAGALVLFLIMKRRKG